MTTVDFGTDFAGGTDFDPMAIEREPDDVLLVAEAAIRRLECPRGGMPGDPDYGYDLAAELRKAMTPAELAAIPNRIRGELLKDDRIERLEASVTLVGLEQLAVAIKCETAAGPFKLTGSVTSEALRLEVTRS